MGYKRSSMHDDELKDDASQPPPPPKHYTRKNSMAVYYKFKSAKDYDSIPMDGPFLSVGTLKEKIFESKHLSMGTDFDVVVTNAQTNEVGPFLCFAIVEYLDEAMLIPKNTSVLIRRVLGWPHMTIVTEQEYYLKPLLSLTA
ncbi:e3 ubiquitin ligase pqt3-like [Quercus suber]|uniref:E3 ubiquitin ligase pqt3-like n=1 Tax=Quercus suber TaxID=58331 RepID=A0AAW0J429_QUESU